MGPENEELNPFPMYMYHEKHGARLFRSREELDKAGGGWVDTPAKLGEKKAETPGTEPTYDPADVERLKKRAKELGIKGWTFMKPATLAKRVFEAERKAEE